MGRRLAATGVACVLLAACTGGADEGTQPSTTTSTTVPSTTTTTPCEQGGRSLTLRGVRVRQFCGPALAEVTVEGELLVFPGGECTRHEDWFALNIGFEVIDAVQGDALLDPEFRSFTVLMGRHPLAGPDAAPVASDGNYTEAGITFAVPGRSYLVEDKTVTMVATRTAGVFSGTGLAGEGPSGPSERGTQGPSGPSERGTQGPSGPSERGTQGHDQPLDVDGVFTCDAKAIPIEQVPALVDALAGG